ncbi:hypothetical protein YC2023_061002 [Brassica napus]
MKIEERTLGKIKQNWKPTKSVYSNVSYGMLSRPPFRVLKHEYKDSYRVTSPTQR